MEQRTPLHQHEIRVVKINREVILDLIRELLVEISGEKFRLPQDVYSRDKMCFDMYFDKERCEIIVSVYRKEHTINQDAFIAYIKNNATEVVDSLFLNHKNKQYYQVVQNNCLFYSRVNRMQFSDNRKQGVLRATLKCFGIRLRSLGKYEVRFIRLSQTAIHELLWEHFMRIGNQMMDLPENADDVIFHMYTEDALRQLTIYVMLLSEASDKAFEDNRAYCDQNIPITADSYSIGLQYASIVLSKA